MTSKFTKQDYLTAVERSPAMVAARDKAGWLALFSSDAVIEDPVGTRPHHRGARVRGKAGDDEFGRFYELFIAPNEVRFEARLDIVSLPFVLRDVLIHTTLPNGFQVEVPAHILYELTEEEDALKIRHLAAYWELRKTPGQALRGGWKGLSAINSQTWRMLKIQRLGGTAGYTRGMIRGTGKKLHRLAARLTEALNARDTAALAKLLPDGEPFEWPAGTPLSTAQFLDALGPDSDGDGSGADALVLTDVKAGGWRISARFTLKAAGAHGIALLDVQKRPRRVARARFFVADVDPLETPATAGTE
ncbi:MAG: hypothetical protein ABI333_03090 [bacterium]